MRKRYDLPWGPWTPCRYTAIMAKLVATDPAMFNNESDVECLLSASEKIITEFAIIAETIIPKISIINVDLWGFSFSSTAR